MQKAIYYCILFTALLFIGTVSSVQAQYVYGSSQLGHDPVTNEVFSYSRTWVDVYVGIDYDPYVKGKLYKVNQQVNSGSHLGWTDVVRAKVDLTTPSMPVTSYTIISEHWIRRATYTSVRILNNYVNYWWDPWGFYNFSPVYSPQYPGSPYSYYVPPQWQYLGYTAVQGITPPNNQCEQAVLPPEDGVLAFQKEESSPADASACPEPTPTTNATVTSAGFTGNHTMYRWSERDLATRQPISNPTWVQGRSDNNRYPVAYTKNTETSNMKLSATLALSPAIPTGQSVSAKIRVKKGSQEVITAETPVTLTGNSLTVSNIQVNKALEATPKLKKSNYNFAWEISFDNGSSWRSMGNSGPHTVYWTFNDPMVNKFINLDGIPYNELYDEALERVTSKLGEGESVLDTIVKKVNKGVAGDLLYDPGEDRSNDTHPLLSYDRRKDQCSGNANLLRGLLRSVGIEADTYYYFGGDDSSRKIWYYQFSTYIGGIPDTVTPSFQVTRRELKEKTTLPDGTVLNASVSKNPHFTFHAMVKVNLLGNNRFDPSYGTVETTPKFIAREVVDYNSPTKKFLYNSATINNIIEINSFNATYSVKDWFCNHKRSATFTSRIAKSFDDDDITDFAVWRPSDGTWYILNSTDDSIKAYAHGSNSDIIVPGDYDGDGYTDPAVFRPNERMWYILDVNTGNFRSVQFGESTDKPVQGDYDGDGKTDVAVFRPSTGAWYYLRSSDNTMFGTGWGQSTDIPVPADYDGDNKMDIAVWRPSDGTWHILQSGTNNSYRGLQWGSPGANTIPVPGDYDNDGISDPAVWHSAEGNWYALLSSSGAMWSANFGNRSFGDIAVPSDYDDDGKTDAAVWRPSDSTWYVLKSSDLTMLSRQWGAPQDIPVPSTGRQ